MLKSLNPRIETSVYTKKDHVYCINYKSVGTDVVFMVLKYRELLKKKPPIQLGL